MPKNFNPKGPKEDNRDCFCDRACKNFGDCCDDIATTCGSYFKPEKARI